MPPAPAPDVVVARWIIAIDRVRQYSGVCVLYSRSPKARILLPLFQLNTVHNTYRLVNIKNPEHIYSDINERENRKQWRKPA